MQKFDTKQLNDVVNEAYEKIKGDDGGNNAAKRRVQALIRDLALRDCCYARAHVDVRQRKLVNVRVPLQCGL